VKTDPQQLERIIAYLDGELSAEESAQVEQRLATDEEFRQDLQGAERAWAALDELSMAKVNEEFSRTTMEMVVDTARQDVEAKTLALPLQRRRHGLQPALLAATAMLLGMVVFRVASPAPQRRLLADLPVIQHIDLYRQFQSVTFLTDLQERLSQQRRPEGRLPVTPAEQEQLQAMQAEFHLLTASNQRSSWLASLPPNKQLTLRAKYNRFQDLSPQRQEELRALHAEIEAASEREQLLQTLFRYQLWLSNLSQSEQYGLRELPSAERARQVAERMQQAASEQLFRLTADQLAHLQASLQPQILKTLRKSKQAFATERSEWAKREQKRFREMSEDEQRMRAIHFAMKGAPEKMHQLSDLIVAALPAQVQGAFENLPPWEKAALFRGWMRQARAEKKSNRQNGKRKPGEIAEEELADFFVDELEPMVKERLLALPRDKMKQQLQRLYRGGPMPEADHHEPPPEWGGPPLPSGPEGRRRGGRRDEHWRPPPGPPPRERAPREEARRPARFDDEGDRRGPPRDREFDYRRRRPPSEDLPQREQ